MTPRQTAALASVTIGLLVAGGLPGAELWLDCRAPASDACVWGKSLWPVAFGVGIVIGASVGAFTYVGMRAWHDRDFRSRGRSMP